jgi:hypothetical protein
LRSRPSGQRGVVTSSRKENVPITRRWWMLPVSLSGWFYLDGVAERIRLTAFRLFPGSHLPSLCSRRSIRSLAHYLSAGDTLIVSGSRSTSLRYAGPPGSNFRPLIPHILQLNNLVNQGVIQNYPPLCEAKGVMTAQFVSSPVHRKRWAWYDHVNRNTRSSCARPLRRL